MKKDTYYFQHDYNAANDVKILYLRQQLGIEGYGIFWFVIEQLAQAGGRLPLKVIPVIAMQIQTTYDKVASVIKNYELFEIENEEFFSVRLVEQIEFRKQLSDDGRIGALKRWGNKAKNSPPITIPNGDTNAKERKGKEKKGKENKGFVCDCFESAEKAFIEIRDDEIFMENLLRSVQTNGFPSADYIKITNAIKKFISKESTKPDFLTRNRGEVKTHLVNWIILNAKKTEIYG